MIVEQEDPCWVTNGPCQWVSEEFFDDFGNVERWDLYCSECFRYRNWDKDEFNPYPIQSDPSPDQ